MKLKGNYKLIKTLNLVTTKIYKSCTNYNEKLKFN
jgi:hypothetical protein